MLKPLEKQGIIQVPYSKTIYNYAQDKKEIDHNDYWFIKDNPLSKVGVFPYLGCQIGEDLEPDKIYYVLRPEEELSKSETLESFKLQPFINDHAMLGTKPGMVKPEDKGIDGVIGEDIYFKDGVIYGDLKLYTESVKEDIESGKKELSLGYFCDYEQQPGEYEGLPYQFIQRNIKVNHIALVDEGRMGADVRVMDKRITFDTIKEIKEMLKKQTKSLSKSALDEDIEEITKPQEDACEGKDEDVDKRKLIDEIGGILKDKVDDEIIKTIIEKCELLSYDDSETGANDEDPVEEAKDEDDKPAEDELNEEAPVETEIKEEEPAKGEVKVEVSMDEMIKQIGQRDSLVDAIKPLVGDNKNYKMMTTVEVAKYACDKLDLKATKGQEVSVLRGYIAGLNKSKVNYSIDNAISVSPKTDEAFDNYIKGV